MFKFVKILAFLTISSLAVFFVDGQYTPKSCNESTSMTFNAQEISGIWYEVGRNPAPTTSMLCIQVNLTLQSNNIMDIRTTFSNTPLYPWVNETIIASVDLGEANNAYGYNFSYTLRDPLPMMTYKLLYTDYTNFALICGYQNVTNNSTFFNILLTRNRMPNGTILNNYEEMASTNFTGFSNSSLAVITQEESCYFLNDANRLGPFISLFLMFAVCFII